MAEHFKRRSVLALISDFYEEPDIILEAIKPLRFLGNDATHVEARLYDDVGQEEAELAIDVTKEVLKGVYQYGDLLERLKARQRGEGDQP